LGIIALILDDDFLGLPLRPSVVELAPLWGWLSFQSGRAMYSRWSSNWRPYRGWLSWLAGLLGPAQNFVTLILLGLRLRRTTFYPSACGPSALLGPEGLGQLLSWPFLLRLKAAVAIGLGA